MNTIGAEPNDWDKHFKLMADIDLAYYDGKDGRPAFNIIAPNIDETNAWSQVKLFTGVFDGNGKKISNFNHNSTNADPKGLFGYVYDPNSQIKDLGLISPNIDAVAGNVGSLVGTLIEGTISNCYVEGGNVAGGGDMFGASGGLVGENYSGTINNCYASGDVSGTTSVGGLVGDNFYGTITNCYASGDVSGTSSVGGLVGGHGSYLGSGGTITCSYASGTVSGTTNVGGLVGADFDTITCSYASSTVSGTMNIGGLVGDNSLGGIITNCYSSGDVSASGTEGYPSFSGGLAGGNDGTITNCYSSGSVSASGTEEYPDGDSGGGGLVGLEGLLWGGGEVINSFWDIQTSGQTTSGGGKGRTTVQMQRASTYQGWDENGNEGIWTIDDEKDYPRLWWENKPGETLDRQHLSDFLEGAGTEDDPYMIYTAEQMNKIGLYEEDWDKHFKLMADIDLIAYTGTGFNIIGYFVDWNDNKRFTGVFDGNGKTISNFSYVSTPYRTENIGLFGCVYLDAEIRNLGLIDPNVDAGMGNFSGLLVGSFSWGTISDCYVEGGNVLGNDFAGGLVGENYMGTITNCASSASVSGNEGIGGLVGYNRCELLLGYGGSITTSYSTGTASGSRQVGGLVGVNEGAITNCYSTGSVSGDGTIGGLVGSHFLGTITNCYASGSVSGNEFGGLVGMGLGGVTDSFWDIQTSGQKWSFEGTGKTTTEMQTADTFLEAGWDYVGETENGTEDIWWIDEGQDYPRLWWEAELIYDLFFIALGVLCGRKGLRLSLV